MLWSILAVSTASPPGQRAELMSYSSVFFVKRSALPALLLKSRDARSCVQLRTRLGNRFPLPWARHCSTAGSRTRHKSHRMFQGFIRDCSASVGRCWVPIAAISSVSIMLCTNDGRTRSRTLQVLRRSSTQHNCDDASVQDQVRLPQCSVPGPPRGAPRGREGSLSIRRRCPNSVMRCA